MSISTVFFMIEIVSFALNPSTLNDPNITEKKIWEIFLMDGNNGISRAVYSPTIIESLVYFIYIMLLVLKRIKWNYPWLVNSFQAE